MNQSKDLTLLIGSYVLSYLGFTVGPPVFGSVHVGEYGCVLTYPEKMKTKTEIDRDIYEQSPSAGYEDVMLIMGCPHGYGEVDT